MKAFEQGKDKVRSVFRKRGGQGKEVKEAVTSSETGVLKRRVRILHMI